MLTEAVGQRQGVCLIEQAQVFGILACSSEAGWASSQGLRRKVPEHKPTPPFPGNQTFPGVIECWPWTGPGGQRGSGPALATPPCQGVSWVRPPSRASGQWEARPLAFHRGACPGTCPSGVGWSTALCGEDPGPGGSLRLTRGGVLGRGPRENWQ